MGRSAGEVPSSECEGGIMGMDCLLESRIKALV